MYWLFKALTQKAITYFPYPQKVNYFFQSSWTIGKELPDVFFLDRLENARHHERILQENGGFNSSLRILELGTGWYPIIPIYFFLKGYENFFTYDKHKLLNKDSLDKTLRAFLKHNIRNSDFCADFIPERIDSLNLALKSKTLQEKLTYLSFSIVNDFSFNEIFDVVLSNNTLQFIPEKDLTTLFGKLSPYLDDHCRLSLMIDLTDEFSHSDKRLHPLNYLKFSKKSWFLLTNKLNRPTRNRLDFYQKVFANKFVILRENKTILELSQKEIKRIHKDYNELDFSILRCIQVHFLLKNANY